MPVLLEVLVAWLVLSPVLAVVVGTCIARAARAAEAREAVPAPPPAGPAGARQRGARVRGAHPALPAPSRPLDDVLHLRLVRPEA